MIAGMFAGTCLAWTSVQASPGIQQGGYLSGSAGIAMPEDGDITKAEILGDKLTVEYDDSWAFTGALGYDFGFFRMEGEFGYQGNDVEAMVWHNVNVNPEGEMTAMTGLANGYIDFENGTNITPFLTGGAGITMLELQDYQFPGDEKKLDIDENKFAYQFGAGIDFKVSNQISLDAKYRYFAVDEIENEYAKVEFASHNVMLGARLNF
jgi:opacity protein-like surface antigen